MSLPEIIVQLLLALSILVVSGCFIFWFLTRKIVFTIDSILAGLIGSTALYASIKTEGISIFSIYIFCAFLYYYLFKTFNEAPLQIDSETNNERTGEWKIFGAYLISYFTIQFSLWHELDTSFESYPIRDTAFYGRLSGYLNIFGSEGTFLSPLKANGVNIYHYGDLWLNSFLSLNNFYNPSETYIFVSIPILLSFCSFYAYRLGRLISTTTQRKSSIILAFVLPILGSFVFLYPSIDFLSMDIYGSGVWSKPKTLLILLFILLACISLLREDLTAFFFFLMSLIFFYTAVFPGVYLSGILFLIYLFKIKKIDKRFFYLTFGIQLIAPILLLCFYSIVKSDNSPLTSAVQSENHFSYILTYSYLKTGINTFGKIVLQMLITNLALLFLIFKILPKVSLPNNTLNTSLIFLGMITFCCAFSYSVFHFLYDAVQFWSNLYIVIVAVLSFITITLLNKIKWYFLTLALIILNLIFNYPKTEKDAINKAVYQSAVLEFYRKERPYVAVAFSNNTYSSLFTKNTEVYPPFPFISEINPAYYATNITTDLIKVSDDVQHALIEQKLIESTPFMLFINEQKKKKAFVSYNNSRRDFIYSSKIKYLATNMGTTELNSLNLADSLSLLFKHNGVTMYRINL